MNYRLRLKHPSGAEFEAEGPAEFILSEKEVFLGSLDRRQRQEPAETRQETAETPHKSPDWAALTEERHGLLTLKHKHPELKAPEAALLILAAERQLNEAASVTALALSKSLKASGYAPERLDRLLTRAIKESLLKASGTKRNRSYHITARGLEKAWLEAKNLPA